VDRYLNLSPFIIDENALSGDACSKLFFYSHQEVLEGDSCYVYKFCDNPEENLTISDSLYPEIKKLIEDFRGRTLRKSTI
jgi:hypothetical protein